MIAKILQPEREGRRFLPYSAELESNEDKILHQQQPLPESTVENSGAEVAGAAAAGGGGSASSSNRREGRKKKPGAS